MTIKKEAAYHEAAHALIAHRSQFHVLIGPINLQSYGSGEILVSLSKSKLIAGGKSSILNPQKDKDVVKDLALVLVAGYVAEQIAADSDETIRPNLDSAKPDHDLLREQLKAAGLSKYFDNYEKQARTMLEDEWHLVQKVADFLYVNGGGNVEEILKLMN